VSGLDLLLWALALMLVLEGLLPALLPRQWRQWFAQLLQLQDGQLRFFGVLLVATGLLLMAFLA
jgi:uncharacterized protein YjeT (DUF2065 family)